MLTIKLTKLSRFVIDFSQLLARMCSNVCSRKRHWNVDMMVGAKFFDLSGSSC